MIRFTRIIRHSRTRWIALFTHSVAPVVTAAVMVACADAPTIPSATDVPAATRAAGGTAQLPAYEVTDLGTLGGFFSVALGVNDAGQVGGSANTADGISHAFLWTRGQMTDIGSLGGNILAIGPNNRGELTALAELPQQDPDNEDLCGFGTHSVCTAAMWSDGAWTQLPMPPSGGRNSVAVNLNDRGQAVGLAETGVRDQSCALATPFQVYRFAPVVWGPKAGDVQVLPLAGDEVGFAYGINHHDQVVGSAGTCATTFVVGNGQLTGQHAVLWDHGAVIRLDPPGSSNTVNTAYSINDRGDVVGVTGSSAAYSAFLWNRRSGMQSIGTVDGDPGSSANWINARGQVVGTSCPDNPTCRIDVPTPTRAFLWQDGAMMDLNALVVGESPLYLLNALAMDDAGQIVGLGLAIVDGEVQGIHAFVATPVAGPELARASSSRVAARPNALRRSAARMPRARLAM